ncbi:MAG: UDP-N-acetylglucosamine 1-carboxyvinyltransferase, partial [Firmicutes bacterium]|nr:UDP-N-acetylglucosamine 1-carboxyvinyltransferase [Bacillota bacterium]
APETYPPARITVQTGPYPGFATDLQSPLTAFLTRVPGMHTVVERVFENRMGYVRELVRMGAQIGVDRRVATVHGGTPLHGATVVARDLRAGAALIIAALAAEGETVVQGAELIERGYERLADRLGALGARIARR